MNTLYINHWLVHTFLGELAIETGHYHAQHGTGYDNIQTKAAGTLRDKVHNAAVCQVAFREGLAFAHSNVQYLMVEGYFLRYIPMLLAL